MINLFLTNYQIGIIALLLTLLSIIIVLISIKKGVLKKALIIFVIVIISIFIIYGFRSIIISYKSHKSIEALGIGGITSSWVDLVQFNGKYGEKLKERIENAENNETWYFVTISPTGFTSEAWEPYIRDAYFNKHIDIVWIYHSVEELKENKGLQDLWKMIYVRDDDPVGHLEDIGNALRRSVQDIQKQLQQKSQKEQLLAGNIKLIESRIPHFYFGFLAIPQVVGDDLNNKNSNQNSAPPGSYGFLQLYPMYSNSYKERLGVYLDGSGDAINIYYNSILKMVDIGVKQGDLKVVYDSQLR